MRRPDKDMQVVREQVLEILKESQKTHAFSFSANEVAYQAGCSVSTAAEILREFGLTTDGYRWFFPAHIIP